MSVILLFDLPVYRLTEEKYQRENIDGAMAMINEDDIVYSSEIKEQIYAYHRLHMGPWQFNEIIGYLRLHRIGTQIRAEYYSSIKKRCVRTRKKIFLLKTLKLGHEIMIHKPYETPQILRAIRECIALCKSELPRRYVDDQLFNSIAPHVKWEGVGI